MLFKDLYATRRLKGLGLGQGGLILCGDARIAYQGHGKEPFAILYIANKRPFENECKQVISCRAGAQSPWFSCTERDLRGSADSRASVLYKERGQLPQNRLGNVHNIDILHI